jgi:hypothetical protein
MLQMLNSIFLLYCPTSAKDMPPFNDSKIFTVSLIFKHIIFYLAFGAPSSFGEADFRKKGRETLSRSHNN